MKKKKSSYHAYNVKKMQCKNQKRPNLPHTDTQCSSVNKDRYLMSHKTF